MTATTWPTTAARPLIAAVIVWLFFILTAAAQSLNFPALTGPVVDQAGILSLEDRAALTQRLTDLEARTGDQFVIVTLKSLDGTAIEDYGYQLGRAWKIGVKGENSGVLLIVAPKESAVRIEVGYGLEGTLTDAVTKIIIETTILPKFKANDLPGGIKAGSGQIIQLLNAAATVEGNHPPPQPAQPIWPIILGALGLIALLIFCAVTGGGLCQFLFQILFMVLASSGGGRSGGGGDSSFSGRGGSFGGGGSSGKW